MDFTLIKQSQLENRKSEHKRLTKVLPRDPDQIWKLKSQSAITLYALFNEYQIDLTNVLVVQIARRIKTVESQKHFTLQPTQIITPLFLSILTRIVLM